MKLSSMFPRRYATGNDLQGKLHTLTITHIKCEKMRPQAGAPEVERWVLYFKETKKGVILSRTLAYQIAEILGSEETNDWLGKVIIIYPQPIQVAGKAVTAIRAKRAPKLNESAASIPTALTETMVSPEEEN